MRECCPHIMVVRWGPCTPVAKSIAVHTTSSMRMHAARQAHAWPSRCTAVVALEKHCPHPDEDPVSTGRADLLDQRRHSTWPDAATSGLCKHSACMIHSRFDTENEC